MTVLVADGDGLRRAAARRALALDGHSVVEAGDAEAALQRGSVEWVDVAVVDEALRGLPAPEVCRRLAASGSTITMLVGSGGVSERVHALDAGADDYLSRPLSLEELAARVRAVDRRRSVAGSEPLLTAGDITLDERRREARRGCRTLDLSAREWDLLRVLVRQQGAVLGHRRLRDAVWPSSPPSNVLEVYIRTLRRKLEAGGEPRVLETVRGFGYRLSAAPHDVLAAAG